METKSFAEKIADKLINENYEVTKEDCISLYDCSLNDLEKEADRIRAFFCKNEGSICSIINAKRGGCSEDCKYCAQSSHWKTSCVKEPLIDAEKSLTLCEKMVSSNVTRTSFVTAGKGLKGNELEKLLDTISKVNKKNKDRMRLCASFGIINEDSMKKIKEAGVVRYHHNLETGPSYYPKICSTHTFEDRVHTIKAARNAGLSICSGGIIGMGETRADRIDMALTLRELGVESIPVNVLSPIPGTPFGEIETISIDEVLKTIAVFRFILKDRIIRMAAGRKTLGDNGIKAFKFGANGLITGDFLTLEGSCVDEDFSMFNELGFDTNK